MICLICEDTFVFALRLLCYLAKFGILLVAPLLYFMIHFGKSGLEILFFLSSKSTVCLDIHVKQ